MQVGDGLCQPEFFLGAVVFFHKETVDVLFGEAGGAAVVDDAHRAHAGELAPGRTDAGDLFEQFIHKAGQLVLRLFFVGGCGGVNHGAFARKAHACREAAARPGQHRVLLLRQAAHQPGVCEKEPGHVLRLIDRGEAPDTDVHCQFSLTLR